jgi:hypothetical protein
VGALEGHLRLDLGRFEQLVAERLGDDPDVHAPVHAVLAVGVAELVRSEPHAQVATRPANHDAIDHVVTERLAASVLLAEQRRVGMYSLTVAAGPVGAGPAAGQVVPDD